ncbi:MAG TPA: tetratricopeptide repeat protein [Thermoflexia bacterium]|nr:tetratricopeptide repeat protein [Thermoflexia bacterium]
MGLSPSISSLIEQSHILARAGDIGAALQRAQEALEQARASGGTDAIAAALVCVAHLHFRQGHYDTARALAEEVLSRVLSDAPVRADALLILGNCAAETDNPAAAEAFYRRAIDLSRQLGYRRALRSGLHNLSANVYVPRGQFELSLAADEESLRLARELGMPEVAWFPLATMGWVYWVTGRRERALATAEELRRFAPPGSLAEGFYYCLRADLAQGGENPESALPFYARARSIAEAIGDPGLSVLLRLGLSRYRRTTGSASTAWDWADDALVIATRVGYHHLQGLALIERGRAAWEIGDVAAAEADLRAAVEILTPLQANFDLARAYLLLAALLHRQQRAEATDAWFETVSRIISGGYAFLLEQERALAFPLLADCLNSDDPNLASVSARLLSRLARVPPPPLRIVTLGRFEVRQGARAIPDHAWRQRRAGELFRLLLISPGRSLFRDQVTEALWPEKSPASMSALFHQATSALRRALEPDLPEKFPSRYLEVGGGRVTLHLPAGSSVDFEIFEEHIRNEEWEAALALYRGDLFPGDRYADWAAAPRERLRQEAMRASLAVARRRLEDGHAEAALDACRRALELEPWQEEAVLLGMQACIVLNDRAGAIRLYLDLERRLREEVGIEPQEDLRRLYSRLVGD